MKDGLKPGRLSPGAARGVRTGKSSGGAAGGGSGTEDARVASRAAAGVTPSSGRTSEYVLSCRNPRGRWIA